MAVIVRHSADRQDRAEQGIRLMHELLDEREDVDGIFATCDLMAMGALKALYASGISVPREMALCGFDGIYATRLTSPAITTVEKDMPAIAARLVSNFIAASEGRDIDRTPVPAKLVIRESSLKF